MIYQSESRKTFIIAEAGVNHNGSMETALRLCDLAKSSGADAIKFQTWITENIILKGAPQANYQQENTKKKIDQYTLLKELELNFKQFEEIHEYCKKIDLQFLSTPDDIDSLIFLVNNIGLEIIKIGSGEITNLPFLKEVGLISKQIILSTGMSNLMDIDYAIKALGTPEANRLTLLQCTSSYPCPYEYANLNVIKTLKNKYKYNIGFSDHTEGTIASIGAVALGAKIIEKHFTLDKEMKGPDHKCSLNPSEFTNMVSQIRLLEKILGEENKVIQEIENDAREKVTKMIVTVAPIQKGNVFDTNNVNLLRCGSKGLNGQNWGNLLGKKAKRDYKIFECVDSRELEI